MDGVLKKYAKERSAQVSQLATLSKKIDELQAKMRAYEQQIAKLDGQESAAQVAIEKLDSRRDEEVGKLLAKLGVQLGDGGSGFKQPTIDEEDQPEADADANGDDSGEEEDEDSDEVEEDEA